MKITKKQLRIAGYFSIANAGFTIPIFIIRDFIDVAGEIRLRLLNVILSFISCVLVLYVVLSLKKLLNYYFQFYQVDNLIYIIIVGNVAAYIISVLFAQHTTIEVLIVSIFTLIMLGSIYIILAIKILSLANNLYGLLIPFAYTLIANGLCLVTVILLPLSLLVNIVSDVFLGIIFFRAAKQL